MLEITTNLSCDKCGYKYPTDKFKTEISLNRHYTGSYIKEGEMLSLNVDITLSKGWNIYNDQPRNRFRLLCWKCDQKFKAIKSKYEAEVNKYLGG